jgi:hypothetical protein
MQPLRFIGVLVFGYLTFSILNTQTSIDKDLPPEVDALVAAAIAGYLLVRLVWVFDRQARAEEAARVRRVRDDEIRDALHGRLVENPREEQGD